MKRNLILSALLLICGIAMAQEPVITFTKTEHDFGKINEADGKVTTVFEFKNDGMTPLTLTNVRASCGCTTPKWTKEPIEPGQSGAITVTYNPNGRPGSFTKRITVTSNASEPTKYLTIRGEVIPKTQQAANRYPVQMGEANVAKKNVSFGTVLNTKTVTQVLEYTNNTDHEITIDVALSEADNWLDAQVSLATLQPRQVGQITFLVDAKKAKRFGEIKADAYLMVNGRRVISDEYKITLTATIDEDFSTLTEDQKLQAPICEVAERTINLGTAHAGTLLKKSVFVKNAGGGAAMYVRYIQNNEPAIKIVAPRGAIKNGKKGEVKIEYTIPANTAAGNYNRTITIVTNDPKAPKMRINLTWTVE